MASSSSSPTDQVSGNTFGLLPPFVFPAPSGPSSVEKLSSLQHNREGKYLDEQGSTGLQSPLRSPISTRACNASRSSRSLVQLSSEGTQAYSTPVRYHLPTRMREIPKAEISCFESDDEEHRDHLSVRKALALASDALAWCTRKRANSLVTPKSLENQYHRVREVTGETRPKIRKGSADQQWSMVHKAQSHKAQWSGSTLNSVTEARTSPVPMCRETRGRNSSKRLGPAMDFRLEGTEVKIRESTSQWIDWYGSNPFEIKEVSRARKLSPPGPPPTCPLPPLPTEDS